MDNKEFLKDLIKAFEMEAGLIARPGLYMGSSDNPIVLTFLLGMKFVLQYNEEIIGLYYDVIEDVRQENGWEISPLPPAIYMMRAGKSEKEITDATLKMELEAYKRILAILDSKNE